MSYIILSGLFTLLVVSIYLDEQGDVNMSTPTVWEMYENLLKYTLHLENALKQHVNMDDETLKHIRACYMRPTTEEDKK